MGKRYVESFLPSTNPEQAYAGSINFDLSQPGKAIPGFDHAKLTNSLNLLGPIMFTIVTTAPNGNPRVYFMADFTCYRIDGDVITADKVFTLQGGFAGDAAIVDDGAGGKVLLVVFGTDTGVDGNWRRDLSTDTNPWTQATGATAMTARLLHPIGGVLYAATGTGASGTNIARTVNALLPERHVCILPQGNSPWLAANWSDIGIVGTDWTISGMAEYDGRLVVASGDGCYVYDNQDSLFHNKLANVAEFIAHSLNGKLCVTGENCVWYGTNDGKLYRFDGIDMIDTTPFRSLIKGRDAVTGRYEALIDRGDRIVAVQAAYANVMNGPHAAFNGVRVWRQDNNGTITELTAGVTDGNLDTPVAANMGGWNKGAVSGDAFLVFTSPFPLEALGVCVTRNPNLAVQSFTTPEGSDGLGGFISLGTIRDSSLLWTSPGISMAFTGFPPSEGVGLLGWTDIDAWQTVKKDTYNGVANVYVYRVRAATTTATTATTTIDEIYVVPGRPPLPGRATGVLTDANNFTGLYRSGRLSRIVEGVRRGGQYIWREKCAIDTGGTVSGLAWHPGPTGAVGNSGPGLLVLGRFSQWLIAESRTGDATQTPRPRLVVPSATTAAPTLRVELDFGSGDPRRQHQLYTIMLTGKFIQPEDKIELDLQVDERETVYIGTSTGTPAVWDKLGEMVGRCSKAVAYFTFKDNDQTDDAAPYLALGVYEYEDIGLPYESEQFPGFADPVAT